MHAGRKLAGRYALEALLGSGGMGEVWRGVDEQLARPVAVKVLRAHLADPELVGRFRREARIAARLQHPGITVVHDVGSDEGQLFIVMELLHGRDLAAMLAEAPAGLPIDAAVSLTIQAAEALRAAHAGHVVHRDLKPANLFVPNDGQLKICDFGIARAVDATAHLTATGEAIGTPDYMSPEQCLGQQVDERSDLYALGCVLYALLTGQPPFAGGQPLAIMFQHINAAPTAPRTIRPDVPPELDHLVLELLAKDPARRPADAGLVIAALQALRYTPTVKVEPAAKAPPRLDLDPPGRPGNAAAFQPTLTKQRRQSILDEITALYMARRWKAVIAAGEQLHQIDPSQPDPDGMLADARHKLADEDIADRYADGLRLLNTGEHESAATLFAAIEQERPGYRDATSLLATARGASPTRVVAKSGGHHTTVAAAITASAAGDRILIKPGEYDESLTIDKDLQIRGDGRLDEITVRSAGAAVISLRAGGAQISNLTIRQTATQDTQAEADELTAAVQIEGGQPVVQDCDISSYVGHGIVIQGNADPTLRGNRIRDNKQCGVFVFEQGRGTFEDNDISANTLRGVELQSGGDPAVRGNRIHDNKQSGVFVFEQGRGTFEDNDISANTFSGVSVQSGGDPAVRANRIHDNKQDGVWVSEQGRGTFEDNDISANTLSGVEVQSGGDPAVRGNRIHDNKQSGVCVFKQGRGTFEDNDIAANTFSGVSVQSGGDPAVSANRIHGNMRAGVLVFEQGRGMFEDNDIAANTLSGVQVSAGGDPAVRANRIHDNKQAGVFVNEQGRGTFVDNDIAANTLSGVEVKFGGDPAVRANRIHDNKQDGVLVFEQGRGTFEDNDISANTGSGVQVKSAGNPTIRANRIHKNRSSGVLVSWNGTGTITENNIFSNTPSNLKVSSAATVTQSGNRTAD